LDLIPSPNRLIIVVQSDTDIRSPFTFCVVTSYNICYLALSYSALFTTDATNRRLFRLIGLLDTMRSLCRSWSPQTKGNGDHL